MDKNQKTLLDTYLRKRKLADNAFTIFEIQYMVRNNLLKEKIDTKKYYTGDLKNIILANPNLIKYLDFKNADIHKIQYLLVDLDHIVELSPDDFNKILNEMFKTVDINIFDLTNINWLRNYYPILEPFYKDRYEELYGWYEKSFSNG